VARYVCALGCDDRAVDGVSPSRRIPGSAWGVVTVRWTPLRIYPLRWFLVYVLPWPKGKLPTTPEFQRTQPTTCTSSASDIHSSG
jgi:hypothetical protein